MTIDEFTKKLNQVIPIFEADFKAAVQARTPVDTGALRAGWAWDRSNPQLHEFVNFMDYATYVENGTEFQRPQMMLATTVLEAPNIMKEAVKKAGL